MFLKMFLDWIFGNSKENNDLKAILSVRTKFIEEGSNEVDKITNVVNKEFNSEHK